MEVLRLARHKQFGTFSEKSEDTLTEQLSFLLNGAEVFSATEKEAEENVKHSSRLKTPFIEQLRANYCEIIGFFVNRGCNSSKSTV